MRPDEKEEQENIVKKPADARDDQEHVMSEEEQLDETLDESFPCSDPPGHISKSLEDKKLH